MLLHCPIQDEIDSLGQARGDKDDSSSRRLLTELLLQMTGVQHEDGIYIFAATNRIQVRVANVAAYRPGGLAEQECNIACKHHEISRQRTKTLCRLELWPLR